jgi:hypothetical protein
MSRAYPSASSIKISKLQINFMEAKRRVYFSRGCKSLMCGVVSETLASRKLVAGDGRSEGSETAKAGADEQKLHTEAILNG